MNWTNEWASDLATQFCTCDNNQHQDILVRKQKDLNYIIPNQDRNILNTQLGDVTDSCPYSIFHERLLFERIFSQTSHPVKSTDNGKVNLRLPTDFIATSERDIDGNNYKFSQLISWDYSPSYGKESVRISTSKGVRIPKLISMDFNHVGIIDQYHIMELEIRISNITSTEPVMFCIYWMGFEATNTNILKIGTQSERMISSGTHRFNVSIPKDVLSPGGMRHIDVVDVWITFFELDKWMGENTDGGAYPNYSFHEGFRITEFNPDTNYQCKNQCKFYYTTTFPTLEEIMKNSRMNKSFMDLFNKGWVPTSDEDHQTDTFIELKKVSNEENLFTNVLKRHDEIDTIHISVPDIHGMMVNPKEMYSLNVYMT